MHAPDHHLAEAREVLCAHFPPPLPGETLFSVCARFHNLSAVRRPALTGLLLFGVHRASAKRCVPAGLTMLVRCLSHLFPSELSILQQHTLAALYMRFMAPGQAARASAACAGPAHARERHAFDWASARFESQHPLRMCPSCVTADRELAGFPFWHLDHQLPGAWVCLDHTEALRLATPASSRNAWVLPVLAGSSAPAQVSPRELGLLQCVADTVKRMCGPGFVDLNGLRTQICHNLEQAGVIRASRAVDPERVRRWIANHLGRTGLTHLHAFDAADASDCVVGALGKKRAHHPLRWALLVACLRRDGAALDPILDALNGPTQPSLPGFPSLPCVIAPARAYDLMRLGHDMSDIARAGGVTRSVVQRWLMDPDLHTLWIAARRAALFSSHESAIRAVLAAGITTRQELRLRASASYLWFQRNEPELLERLLPRSRADKQIPLWSLP